MAHVPGELLTFLIRMRECFAEEVQSVTCSSAQNGALYMKDNFARSESHVEQGLVLPEPLTAVVTGSLCLLLHTQPAAGEIPLDCHSVSTSLCSAC